MKSNIDIIKDYVSGERPYISVGYTDDINNSNRKEGDTWEDSSGKKWEIKNGFKVRVGKKAKRIYEKRCSKCNADTRWGNYLDDRVWPKTGYCYDCFVETETQYKKDGVWILFTELRQLRNEKTELKEIVDHFIEAKNWFVSHDGEDMKFMNEDGSEDNWGNKEDYSKFITKLTEDLKVYEDQYNEVCTKLKESEKKWSEYESTRNN